MAKLYYTKDVMEVFDKKLKERAMKILADEWLDNSEISEEVQRLRDFKGFTDEVFAEMMEEDRKDDEAMLNWKALRESDKVKGLNAE